MARLVRIVIPGVAHHVIQRGNRRQSVFFSDDDRRFYLALMRDGCAEAQVRCLALVPDGQPRSPGPRA